MNIDSPWFTRKEFACRCGCGFDTVDSELLNLLNCVRSYFDSPVIITSGCRCKDYNANVGGAKDSQHVYGRAADFYVRDVSLESVHKFCTEMLDGKGGLGFYPRKDRGWIHIDSRTADGARWNG